MNADALENYTTLARGRMQRVWTVHKSQPAETTTGPWGELEFRWTLRVYADGVVETARSIPYSGQRYFSTENRPNRADKSSEYRLSVEEVLDRHASACAERGGEVSTDDLRGCVLAVLRSDDVATNANGQPIDLLADGERRS